MNKLLACSVALSLLGLVPGCGGGAAYDTTQVLLTADDLREIAENAYSGLQDDGIGGARDAVDDGLADLEEMEVGPDDQAALAKLKQDLNELKTLLEGSPSKSEVEAKLKAMVTASGGELPESESEESDESEDE